MKQKRKVKSLVSRSETGELSVFSRFLIILSCIFFFGALMLFTFSASFVDAASSVFTGLDENAEVVYELDFADQDNLSNVKAKIYMRSNQVGKDNIYIEPYSVVVTRKLPLGDIGNKDGYVNLLGGNDLSVTSSSNISMIGGDSLSVANSNNATILGGEKNGVENGQSSVVVGGINNTVKGKMDAIVGGENNVISGQNSFILGGYGNNISVNNSVVAGINVNVNKKEVFVFSNDKENKFNPKVSNAFYINVQKGLGLNMDAAQGVASSGAVSFGLKGSAQCTSANNGLIGLEGTCLYGCNGKKGEWQKLGCFDYKLTPELTEVGSCTGTIWSRVHNTANGNNLRYVACDGEKINSYRNVVFETILWDQEGCPEIKDGKNPCVYACAEGYHYYNGVCKKDCKIPWDESGVVLHGTEITGYKEKEVVCEEKNPTKGCEKVRAVLTCDDGTWKYKSGEGGNPVYSGGDILYKYEKCETKENKCNTGVYQYINTGIQYWKNLGNCNDHHGENDKCILDRTVYTGRCFWNHTLTGANCKLGIQTKDCICKPDTRLTGCASLTLPQNTVKISTGFIQTATGEDNVNNRRPVSKSYVYYTESKDGECTYKCVSDEYRYITGNKLGVQTGCWKDCTLPWTGKKVPHGTIITGYSLRYTTCSTGLNVDTSCSKFDANMMCYNGVWTGYGKDKNKEIYTGGQIKYKYEKCTTLANQCNTGVGVYEYTQKLSYAECDSCTHREVKDNACSTIQTWWKCDCWGNYYLSGNICVPKTRSGVCAGGITSSGGTYIITNSGFTQTATGKTGWTPISKNYAYAELTGECTYKCANGYSYSTSEGKCLKNCTYGGKSYKNGEMISGYKASAVECTGTCESKNLKCVDGSWRGGSLTCKTTDKVCSSNYSFTSSIAFADCTACRMYSGSDDGKTCTNKGLRYKCTCWDDDVKGHYKLSGSKCVPATGDGYCTGNKPKGNVAFPMGHIFTQTWSGGAGKWIPASIYYHTGAGYCGFHCLDNNRFDVASWTCIGTKCIGTFDNAVPVPGSSVNLGDEDVTSTLYNSASDANGKKCAYLCKTCYHKNSNQCDPNNFKITYKCMNSLGYWYTKSTSTLTYGNSKQITEECPKERTGYNFVGWATGMNVTTPKWGKNDWLTMNNYSECDDATFYAVYGCDGNYHMEQGECVSNVKTMTLSCGVWNRGAGYKIGTASYTLNCTWNSAKNKWDDCEKKERTYTSNPNPGVCEYTCQTGYKWENGQCVLKGQCAGPEPMHATFVTGSDSGLEGNVQRKAYPHSEIYDDAGNYKGTVKCAYECKPGFIAYNGDCVPCKAGTWDASDPDHCMANVECPNDTTWSIEEGKCLLMGKCRWVNGTVNSLPISSFGNINWTKMEDLLPLPGKGDGYLQCKEYGESVAANTCTYSCQNGSYCTLSSNYSQCKKPRCASGPGAIISGSTTREKVDNEYDMTTQSKFVNVDTEDEFRQYVSQHPNSCRYWCPSENQYWGCEGTYSSPICYSSSEEVEKKISEDCSLCTKENHFGYDSENVGNPSSQKTWVYYGKDPSAILGKDCAWACDPGSHKMHGYYLTNSSGLSSYSDNVYSCWKECGDDEYLGSPETRCHACPRGTILDTSGPSVTLKDDETGMTRTLYTTCKAITCPDGSQLDPQKGKSCVASAVDGVCPSNMPNGKVINGVCKVCLDPDKTITDTGECI